MSEERKEVEEELTFALLKKSGNLTNITMTDKAIVELYAEKFGYIRQPPADAKWPKRMTGLPPIDKGIEYRIGWNACKEAYDLELRRVGVI